MTLTKEGRRKRAALSVKVPGLGEALRMVMGARGMGGIWC
jgi:hypothetical protein